MEKNPNAIPSTRTVNTIVDSKIAVSQKQLGTVLSKKEDSTIYTDETRKYGKTLEAYLVTDSEQNCYLLGLREMLNKSGVCTLDTFKEILSDITNSCHVKELTGNMNVGYQILANIRDTMSDRASTEKAFNRLLEEYRLEILPQVIDGWADMDKEEKKSCSKMNNFFCGLHLLVGMADVCELCVKKFELFYSDGKDKGSAVHAELKRYHRSESGTLRLLRTSSKAFAVGEDEKSGASLEWKTYLKGKNEKKLVTRFKHNRFNLVFVLGKGIYYHAKDMSYFLDTVHGTTNSLLKAVSLDIKEVLFLAGVKSFGLISEFISAPLWRKLEEPGHIIERNETFKTLTDFLKEASNDVGLCCKIIRGEVTPFNTTINEDAG